MLFKKDYDSMTFKCKYSICPQFRLLTELKPAFLEAF